MMLFFPAVRRYVVMALLLSLLEEVLLSRLRSIIGLNGTAWVRRPPPPPP